MRRRVRGRCQSPDSDRGGVGVWPVRRGPSVTRAGVRAVLSGLLFPCSSMRRLLAGSCVPALSHRGLDRLGGQGPGRRSDLDRCFDGQPSGILNGFTVGAVPSIGAGSLQPSRPDASAARCMFPAPLEGSCRLWKYPTCPSADHQARVDAATTSPSPTKTSTNGSNDTASCSLRTPKPNLGCPDPYAQGGA